MSQSNHILCEALLDVLDDGLIVCERDGAIVMHNRKAHELLTQRARSPARTDRGADEPEVDELPAASPDQLMRTQSIFAYINRALLTDTFDAAQHDSDPDRLAVFATPLRPDQLLRVKVSPMPAADDGTPRYVLRLWRMRPWSESDAARHQFLQTLAEGLRDPLASVRAAIETMTEYPGMDPAIAAQFKDIILEQSVVLSERLDEALEDYAAAYRSRWPLDEMAGRDLLMWLHTQMADRLVLPVQRALPTANPGVLRVRVDPHALAAGVVFLAQRVVNAVQCDQLTLRLQSTPGGVAVDLQWTGSGVSSDRLAKWTVETVHVGDTIISMTLRDILNRHDADIQSRDEADGNPPHIRLTLPSA